MSVSCVCASDVDDAVDLNCSNINSDSSIGGAIFESADAGSFDDLQGDIDQLSPGDTYGLDKDYYYDDGDHTFNGIHICQDNITINGNWHIINGMNKSVLFYISGKNVKIVNLTFMNSYYSNSQRIHLPTFDFESGRSPIFWEGDNGIVSNCIFNGNSALVKGGAITWMGNNGLINNSLFINNTAGVIGGAIYMAGSNNTIRGSLFINSTSLIGGEVIYLDRNHKKCNISVIYGGEKLITDGRIANIDVNYFSYIYESRFAGEKINLIPILYCAMISENAYVSLNNDTTYYVQCIGNEFILTLTRNYDNGFIYQRGYHFYNVEDLDNVFQQLLDEKYKNDVTLTKEIIVGSLKEYEYASTIRHDSIFTREQSATILEDFYGVKDASFNEILSQLNVEIASDLIIDCKNTWNPSENGFDVVNINGYGSTIKTSSGDRDENKWVTIADGCIFSASNLVIEGFNTAVENLGGIAIFKNINFNKNHMDYWFDKDWGAAILNAGVCSCINCSFTDNECENGGAIFNQGRLTLYNCTFKGNRAYEDGDNVLNADKGMVYVDGVKIDGSKGCVVYVESMSTATATIISVCGVGASFLIGTFAGMFTLNPAAGILVGAGIGAAIGAGCSKAIISNVYDVNVNRYAICITLVAGCAVAGALGGYVGCSLAQGWAVEAAENGIAEESINVDNVFSSSGFDDAGSLSDLSSECQELLDIWYTDAELDAMIAEASEESVIAENSLHYLAAVI